MYTVIQFSQVYQTKTNEGEKVISTLKYINTDLPASVTKHLYISFLRFFSISVKGDIKHLGYLR